MSDDFDDRVARIEEHVVTDHTTAYELLARAERRLAEGRVTSAQIALTHAKFLRDLEEPDGDA